jgi:hypothetical protein
MGHWWCLRAAGDPFEGTAGEPVQQGSTTDGQPFSADAIQIASELGGNPSVWCQAAAIQVPGPGTAEYQIPEVRAERLERAVEAKRIHDAGCPLPTARMRSRMRSACSVPRLG